MCAKKLRRRVKKHSLVSYKPSTAVDGRARQQVLESPGQDGDADRSPKKSRAGAGRRFAVAQKQNGWLAMHLAKVLGQFCHLLPRSQVINYQ